MSIFKIVFSNSLFSYLAKLRNYTKTTLTKSPLITFFATRRKQPKEIREEFFSDVPAFPVGNRRVRRKILFRGYSFRFYGREKIEIISTLRSPLDGRFVFIEQKAPTNLVFNTFFRTSSGNPLLLFFLIIWYVVYVCEKNIRFYRDSS